MPLTLTLNTAAKRVQFLLSEDSALLCAQDWLTRNDGTELLATALDFACRSLGRASAEIARVACVAGPGSFTGIRLALATSAGLARANGGRQAGLDYLQCLAATAQAGPGERVGVYTVARRGWLYSGDYVVDAQGIPRLQESIVLLPEPRGENDLLAFNQPFLADLPIPDYLVGNGVAPHREFFELLFPVRTRILSPACNHPSSAALLALTNAVDWEDDATLRDVEPLYLRAPDAVDNLDAIAAARGESPGKARSELERLLTSGL